MDVNKLRTLVFEKSGIKIDSGDPIFALVALNEAVLAECVEPHVAALNQAADKLNAQTSQLLDACERYKSLLQQLGTMSDAGTASQVAMALAAEQSASNSPSKVPAPEPWRWVSGAVCIALLSAALTLCGQWVLVKQNPPPQVLQAQPAPTVAQTLTPDQTLLIQNGEKYNKMWSRLDAKTRNRIQVLIQQP